MGKLSEQGFLSLEELREYGQLPSEERMEKGPVAVLECCQNIPCNPCEKACPFGAIHIGKPITNLPSLDTEKCTGCGTCIAHCSGLAIFVVDKSYSECEGTVSFPYEYLPLPQKGQQVKAVNRAGEEVCDAVVIRVVDRKAADHTPVVTIAVPKELADTARGIRRLNYMDIYDKDKMQYVYEASDPDDCLICRCEEVTVGEVREVIRQGADTISEVKRRTRAGMGLCQGRTCSKIIARMLAVEKQKGMREIMLDTARTPVKPVAFGAFLE